MNTNYAIGFLFERTTRLIKLRFHQLFKENNVHISPEQWVVLDILYPNHIMSQKELVEKSFKDAPSISRILVKLIKSDYIIKKVDEFDKRLFRIELTEKGKELVNMLRPKVKELRSIGIQNFNEEEIKLLIAQMNQIFDNYNK